MMQYVVFTILISSVEGQRGPKRGFPTLRCDAPGGGWRCDAGTLRRSGGAGGAATLRRCQGPATLWRCNAATLPLGQWRCGAVDAATLRCCRAGATLRRCWRCDAGAALRRCWRCDAATLRRCDGGSTLRRCWRCDAVGAATRRGFAAGHARCIYSTWCNALHQGTQGLNDVSLLSCQLGIFILYVVIASFWMRNAWVIGLSLREVALRLRFQLARAI